MNKQDYAGDPSYLIKGSNDTIGEYYQCVPFNAEFMQAYGEWLKQVKDKEAKKSGAV